MQLGLDYPWLAQDLDLAASALGNHVKAEFDRRRREAEKKLSPPATGAKGKASRRITSPHRSLSEERIGEIWIETVAEITEDKLVFHIDGSDKLESGQGAARWRIEKPVTGDKEIDSGPHKGARTTFDEHGRRRGAWDASGRQVFAWKPRKA